MSEPDELSYKCRIADLEELRGAVEAAWHDAWREDPALRAAVNRERGPLDPPPVPFEFDMDQGVTPLEVTLIVMVAHAAVSVSKTMILDTWRRVLLPRLEHRYGQGTLREIPADDRQRRD